MSRPQAKRPTITTTLDLGRVIFDGDRELRKQLVESRSLARYWRQIDTDGAAEGSRRDLLKNTMRLTKGIAPSLFKCIEQCVGVLGLSVSVDAFCKQDSQANAFVLPPREDRITMGFTSAAIEALDDGEMCSIIGHELGHVLFDHFALRPLLAFQNDDRLAPVDAMRLYAWMRYAELSADRVGLLCCDSFDQVISAEFKLASGLTDPRILGNVKESASQYASLRAEAIEHDENDWFATHPYSPLRVRALDLFYQSKTFQKLKGRKGGRLSEAELEREIAAMMDLMNPAFLNHHTNCRPQIKEFLALGGVSVALADKKLEASEVEAIRAMVGEGKLLEHLDEMTHMTEKARWGRLGELAAMLRMQLSPLRRAKLLEDLVAVALADKVLDDAERSELYTLAGVLSIGPSFIDQALSRPQHALD